MAEPVSGLVALGIASNAISVVDFACKVTKATYTVLNSATTTSEENAVLEELARDYERLSLRLPDQSVRPVTAEEAHVEELSEKERLASKSLCGLLEQFKLDESKRGFKRLVDGGTKMTKSIMAKSKIENERKHLSDLNEQLSLALIKLLSTRQIAHFQRLEELVGNQGAECVSVVLSAKALLLDMKEHVKQHFALAEQQLTLLNDMRVELRATSSAVQRRPAADNFIKSYKDYHRAQALVDSLTDDNMTYRWDTGIYAPYETTCEWIFNRSETRNWFKSENGIFWIVGRPGTGKSTLVKFMEQDVETQDLLTEWAGNKDRVVVVRVAISRAGPALQKSRLGMMQSIMYQILADDPELVPVAFPRRWRPRNAPSGTKRGPWTWDELLQALINILRLPSYKFCFFIDGLDELDDIRHSGEDLEDALQSLAAFPNVKLCLSGRLGPIFGSHSGNARSVVMLKYGTEVKQDKRQVLHDIFGTGTDPIVTDITHRAHAKFLWALPEVYALPTSQVSFRLRRPCSEDVSGLDGSTDYPSQAMELWNLAISEALSRDLF